MKDVKYFALRELLQSKTALNHGIENLPDWYVIENLKELAMGVLDPIRIEWGQALIVTSGFRNPELNTIVGGVPTSAHMDGQAVDITLPSWSTKKLKDLYDLIVEMTEDGRIDVDQVIYYRKKKIIHISNNLPCRKQFIIK